jgi:1-acyl-sn-glycerol-3-phosphate acyltransferase
LKNSGSLVEGLNTLCYRSLRYIGVILLKAFFSFRVVNTHLVPANGHFIITANHCSFMDPVALQAACPRRIIFMMTEKYYKTLWTRWFFKLMYAIPLRDDTPYNIGPLKKGLRLLQGGKVIGIFPEGGISRTGGLQEGKPGTMLLAQKSQAPVLPAFISGTFEALPWQAKFFRKARITVTFGEPIGFDDLSHGARGQEGLQRAIDNLMQKINELALSQ